MDANNKAAFENSVSDNQTAVCPNCSATVKPGAKFCVSCGAKLGEAKPDTANEAPAFAPAKEEPVNTAPTQEINSAPAFSNAQEPVAAETVKADAGTAFSAFEQASDAQPSSASPAFAPADSAPAQNKADSNTAFKPAETKAKPAVKQPEEKEPESVFAQGLPEWSIEPPLTAVRRNRKK